MCYKPHTEHTHNTHNTLCAEGTAEKIPLCISLAHLHLGSLNVPSPAPALAICHLMLAVRMAFNSSSSLSFLLCPFLSCLGNLLFMASSVENVHTCSACQEGSVSSSTADPSPVHCELSNPPKLNLRTPV